MFWKGVIFAGCIRAAAGTQSEYQRIERRASTNGGLASLKRFFGSIPPALFTTHCSLGERRLRQVRMCLRLGPALRKYFRDLRKDAYAGDTKEACRIWDRKVHGR